MQMLLYLTHKIYTRFLKKRENQIQSIYVHHGVSTTLQSIFLHVT